tara:strand:+ start:3244 stop:4578 length:1335 start_codon:yes stop_codon:yes gene_type:complete
MFHKNNITNLTIDKILLLLVITLPAALVSGPFIPDLFTVVIGIIFLVYYFQKKILLNSYTNLIRLFIFFYLWCLFSSLTSSNILLSLESSIFYFRFALLVFVIIYLLEKFETYFFRFLFYVFLFLLVLILISQIIELVYYKFFVDTSWFNHGSIYGGQLSGIFGNEQKSGSYVARFYPLIMGIVLYDKSNFFTKHNNFLLLIIFLLASLIIILSAERSSIALFLISNFIFFLIFKKIRIILLLSFIISFISVLSYSFFIADDQKNRIFDATFDQLIDGGKLRFFSKHHESHYKTAINMFHKNPIKGIGPKIFRYKCDDPMYRVIYNFSEHPLTPYKPVANYGCATHPHNTYLQLLAEIGFIGFGFIFTLFSYITYKLLFYYKNRALLLEKSPNYFYLLVSSLICIFISLFPFLPTGNFFNNWINIIYYFPIGIFLYTHSKIKLD